MTAYRKILVAIDFSASAEAIIKRAIEFKETYQSELLFLHVVDHLPPLGFGEEPLIAPNWMIPEKELMASAEKSLDDLLQKHDLPNQNQLVTIGSATNQVVLVADDNQVDLIMIGSHGRHGVQLLLGSTANGVLHHANCDVLAIRVTDTD